MSRTGKWVFGMLIFAIAVLATTWAFSAQHCINIDMNGKAVLVDYSSPDSLGAIVIMLEFDGCVPVKANWRNSIPNTEFDFISIDGNRVVAGCFGYNPRIKPGENLNLLVIHFDRTPCDVDTFTNEVGSRTCMYMPDGQVIYPEINFNFTDVEDETEDESIFPKEFSIDTYPNPFNPSMMIKYNVPQKSVIKIDVYNIRGQQVVSLVNSEHTSGLYYISWNTLNQASGPYFVRISAPEFTEVKKVILLK